MTDPGRLDERYGRRAPARRGRTVALAVAGVVLLVGATLAVFLWSRAARPPIDFTVSGYQVLGDDSTRVDFTVDKPDGTAVSCRVVAQDRSADVVGSQDVALPAAGRQVTRSVTVRTRGRAVVGTVVSCAAVHG